MSTTLDEQRGPISAELCLSGKMECYQEEWQMVGEMVNILQPINTGC
jgi:hypothetical protein